MPFRVYSNALSQASRTVAAGIMVAGLLLVGVGMLIIALPEVFALLAAMVFFLAGIGCAITAIKIFWVQQRLDRAASREDADVYRDNVRIHTGDPHNL